MWFYLKLSARNVFRHYGRTLLSMVSIVAGVAVIILGRGMTGGLKENLIRSSIESSTGHVLVVPADYPTAGLQHPIDKLLTVDPALKAWLDDQTVAWTGRVLFAPTLIRGVDSMRVRAFGFDPQTDEQVFPRTQWKVTGTIPSTAADGILVARGVASVFQLKVGDPVVLTVRTSAGAINALQVPVAGLVTTTNPLFDTLGIFVPIALAQELAGVGDGRSHLALALSGREQAVGVAKALSDKLGAKARVTTWEQETRGAVEAQDLRQAMLDVIAFALVAIAATGIANTILMAAYERVKEVGTLRAMGMTRGGVLALFLGEGLVMGVLGGLLGAALGGGVVHHYAAAGIDMSSMIERSSQGGTMNDISFSPILYMAYSSVTVVWAAVFGVVIAVLASIYPAIVASRQAPADAVRAS